MVGVDYFKNPLAPVKCFLSEIYDYNSLNLWDKIQRMYYFPQPANIGEVNYFVDELCVNPCVKPAICTRNYNFYDVVCYKIKY